MRSQWCRAEGSSLVTDNTRLHHDAPRRAEQPAATEGEPATAKRRAPIGRRTPACRSLTPGFLRGPYHLVDEALRLRSTGAADAPRPNTQIAVAHGHCRAPKNAAALTVPKTSLILLA